MYLIGLVILVFIAFAMCWCKSTNVGQPLFWSPGQPLRVSYNPNLMITESQINLASEYIPLGYGI